MPFGWNLGEVNLQWPKTNEAHCPAALRHALCLERADAFGLAT